MSRDALVLETERCFVAAAKDGVKYNAWLAATAAQSGVKMLFAAALLVQATSWAHHNASPTPVNTHSFITVRYVQRLHRMSCDVAIAATSL
jgi:hypothetical protein